MDDWGLVRELLGATCRLIFLGGKGGTGKTTAAAAAGLFLAACSKDPVLIFSTDPAHSLKNAFSGHPMPENLTIEELDPSASIQWFSSRHREPLGQLLNEGTFLLADEIDRTLDLPLPGLEEWWMLTRIIEAVEGNSRRTVIVDTAPWGHTRRLLRIPALLSSLVALLESLAAKPRYLRQRFGGSLPPETVEYLAETRGFVEKANWILKDPGKTRFIPVCTPQEIVVAGTQRLLRGLDEMGITTPVLLVNKIPAATGGCPVCLMFSRLEHLQLGSDLFPGRARILLPRLPASEWIPASLWKRPDFQSPCAGPLPGPPRVAWPLQLRLEGPDLWIVGGKGGTGKTTVASALASVLALGFPDRRISLVSTDPAHSLADALATSGSAPETLPGNLQIEEVDALEVARQTLSGLAEEIKGVFRQTSGANLPFEERAFQLLLEMGPPGLEEVFSLLRVARLLDDPLRTVVVDCAASGHMIKLLETPKILENWLRLFTGVLLAHSEILGTPRLLQETMRRSREVRWLRRLLTDASRTRFVGVLTPERLCFLETRDLASALTRLGIFQAGFVLNQVHPRNEPCAECAGRNKVEWELLDEMKSVTAAPVAILERGSLPTGFARISSLGKALFIPETA